MATSLGEVAYIERFHGAVKERCKVMRGFSRYESASLIMDGWTVYYNYIRHHTALRGSTPAEAAGINIKLGRNRWQTLILRNNWKRQRSITHNGRHKHSNRPNTAKTSEPLDARGFNAEGATATQTAFFLEFWIWDELLNCAFSWSFFSGFGVEQAGRHQLWR